MAPKQQRADRDTPRYTVTQDFGDFKAGDVVTAEQLGDQLDAAIEAGALAPVSDAVAPPESQPEQPTARRERTIVDPQTGTITVVIA